MKVLVAAPLYPPEIGGPATHVALLEREMPKRGLELDVLAFKSVRHLPKVVRHVAYAVKLWRRARGAEVIYVLDPVSVGLPAYVASRLSGVPYVLRIGGDYAWEQGVQRFGIEDTLDAFLARNTYPPFVSLLHRIQSFVAQRARSVIAPSAYLAGVAVSWGVERSRVVVAYSAPDPLPVFSRAEARRALNMHEDVFLVASAGRLVPWKGFEALIDAVGIASQTIGSTRLVIAGDGPDMAALATHIKETKLESMVALAGRLPHTQVAQLLYAADCFVLNTRYEGLSHQLVEAFMASAPVITTAAGGNPELVEDGISGMFVPFNDTDAIAAAIVMLSKDADLRERLRTGGTKRLSVFDADVALTSIEQALTKRA